MKKTIKYAGIAGILSLVLVVLAAILGILKDLNKLESGFLWLPPFLYTLSLMLYLGFLTYGFKPIFKFVSEKSHNNLLLRISSLFWLIMPIPLSQYLATNLASPSLESDVLAIYVITFLGIVGILFSISLLKLEPVFGSIATFTGVITVIMGICFVSVIFVLLGSPIFMPSNMYSQLSLGSLLLIPSYILTAIILFRAAKKIETNPAI